ncbi:MAG TPA: hypothetical protein VFV37_07045 [Luteibaculaceae bacterium]|nr:hypothetical protein [Luteibaculaceae bacterium]
MAFGFLRALIFIAMGIYILTAKLNNGVSQSTQYVLGAILMVYGIFRGYKTWEKNRNA